MWGTFPEPLGFPTPAPGNPGTPGLDPCFDVGTFGVGDGERVPPVVFAMPSVEIRSANRALGASAA